MCVNYFTTTGLHIPPCRGSGPPAAHPQRWRRARTPGGLARCLAFWGISGTDQERLMQAFACVYTYVRIRIYDQICIPYVHVCVYLWTSPHTSIYPIHPSICLSTCLHMYLPVHLSIDLGSLPVPLDVHILTHFKTHQQIPSFGGKHSCHPFHGLLPDQLSVPGIFEAILFPMIRPNVWKFRVSLFKKGCYWRCITLESLEAPAWRL